MLPRGMIEFEILLEKPTAIFIPGEVIRGQVIIELNRPKGVRAVILKFEGVCKVHWSESSGIGSNSNTDYYDGTEIYFQTDQCIFGNADSGTIDMPPGRHVIPFSYNLPDNIPNSFEHNIGKICYSIKAIFHRPWTYNRKISKTFIIEAPYKPDPSDHHENIGIDDDFELNYCCVLPCINNGNMSVKLRIPKTVFTYGDTIDAAININNESNADVTKIKLKLEQRLTFYTQSRRNKKNVDNILQEAKKSGQFPNNTEVKLGLQVPNLLFYYLKHCNLIDINYRLHICISHNSSCIPTRKYYDVLIVRSLAPLTVAHDQLIPLPITYDLAPSQLQTMSETDTSAPYELSPSASTQENLSISNENSTQLSPNLPYPLDPSTGKFPVPPKNIHRPSLEVDLVRLYPISPQINSDEAPPPSYETAMANRRIEIENE